MKILFVGYYDPFRGGRGIPRIQYFAQSLLDQGDEIFVLSPKTIRMRNMRWAGTFNGIFVLRFFAISPRKVPIIGGMFNILSAFLGFLLMYVLRKPQVIIFTLPSGEPPLGVFMACRLFKKPVIFDIMDEWEDFRINREAALASLWYTLLKKLYNSVYNEGLFCIAVTPIIIDHLVRRGIRKVRLLPLCVDASLFRPRDKTETRIALGLEPADFIVIYAGMFEEYYKIDVVINAVHKLVVERGIKNLKLLIVGSGLRMKEYVEMVEQLKLSENVHFTGLKPREEVAEFLGCSDVGVIPYDANPLWVYPLPTKFYEYCSSGLPVIASVLERAILATYIKKWNAGLVVKPLDVNEMSDAIEFLYCHEEKRTEMGLNGRKLVLTHFDREKVTSSFLKLLSNAFQ